MTDEERFEKMFEQLEGSYPAILKRLKTTAMIESFLEDFLEDEEFSHLEHAMEVHDDKAAFEAAHALKGVALNLELGFLAKSLIELTEALRYERKPNADELYLAVRNDYWKTVRIIKGENTER